MSEVEDKEIPGPLPESRLSHWPIWILRGGALGCLAGWSWQHLRWGVPYGAVLWNPDYMEWLPAALGRSWEDYVAEIVTDHRLLMASSSLGFLYLIIAVMALTAKKGHPLQLGFLWFGSGLLAVVAFAKFVNSGHSLPTLVEQGGQVLAPAVLVLALCRGLRDRWTLVVAIVAFCATFGGHGIYAAGLEPTPGQFYGMVHQIFGLEEGAADVFLKVVGVLDFVVCLGVLLPLALIRRASLVYAAMWGFLTALARPVAGMSLDVAWWGADQYLHEAFLRAPHVTLPLFLLFALRTRRTTRGELPAACGG